MSLFDELSEIFIIRSSETKSTTVRGFIRQDIADQFIFSYQGQLLVMPGDEVERKSNGEIYTVVAACENIGVYHRIVTVAAYRGKHIKQHTESPS